MQGDGNFVLYDAASQPLRASNTVGTGASMVEVQDDGNLVVYSAAGAVWATNTVQ
jgi:hypothetical protein